MPTAPKRKCAEPTCEIRLNVNERCPIHHKPWGRSNRSNRLPGNWRNIRERILNRDSHTCYLCGKPGYEVDHIQAGDNHHPSNLSVICTPCHRRKSALEGVEAKKQKRQNP